MVVNIGGEGELAGVLNQQGPWVILDPHYRSSVLGLTFTELVAAGHDFLICPNDLRAIPDGSCDVIYTNSIPINRNSTFGPGVQSADIKRKLKAGGVWYRDGQVEWVQP